MCCFRILSSRCKTCLPVSNMGDIGDLRAGKRTLSKQLKGVSINFSPSLPQQAEEDRRHQWKDCRGFSCLLCLLHVSVLPEVDNAGGLEPVLGKSQQSPPGVRQQSPPPQTQLPYAALVICMGRDRFRAEDATPSPASLGLRCTRQKVEHHGVV